MGKRFRYIVLTFTVVLAIFAFAMLWVVRPGYDSKVLDEARARQEKTLLEVSAPLKTDIVKLSAEEEMARKVSDILKSDEEFIASVSQKLEATIPGYVESYTAKYTTDLDKNIRSEIDRSLDEILDGERESFYGELADGIMARVEAELDSREVGYLEILDEREKALIERITTDVWNVWQSEKAKLTEELLTQFEAIGTEMVQEASDATEIAVLNKIAEQEDYFVELVADAFADGMYNAANGNGVDPYTGIVVSTADGVLDGLAGGNALTSDEKTKAAIENIVMHVLDRIDMAEIADRLDSLENAPIAPVSVVPDAEEEVEPRVPGTVKLAVPPTQRLRNTDDSNIPTTAEEYESERAKQRKAEIDRILSGLMK